MPKCDSKELEIIDFNQYTCKKKKITKAHGDHQTKKYEPQKAREQA